MKRAAAIVLSLIFLWLQAVSSAPTYSLPAKAAGAGCDCKQMDCCVVPGIPETQSLPATIAPVAGHTLLSPPVSTLVAWTLPATATAHIFVSVSTPLPALGVPLFTRNCARLI